MQSRTLHIYWAEHEQHLPPVSQAGLHLPEAVHWRWQQYRTPQQRNMSMLAKRLLHYGLQQLKLRVTGGLSDLGHHPNGKPYLAHLPVQFSLSHSNQLSVCVVSDGGPVGIDIQERVPIPPNSESLFLTATEQQSLNNEDRLVLWCRKEAAYKAVGHELGTNLKNFRFTEPLRVECPPMTLELIPQLIRADYVCYVAVPVDDWQSSLPIDIILEHVQHPY